MPATDIKRPDRRRSRTRTALLRAAQALFADRAVDGVSIDDIVAAADVAKGSFYNHVPDKQALAAALVAEAQAGVETLAARIVEGASDPAERVARAVCGFARQALENPVGVRAGLRLFHDSGIPDLPMDRGVRADVSAGLASGRFGALGLEAAVLMAVGIVRIAVVRTLKHDRPAEAASLSQDLAFGLLRGLGLGATDARAIAAHAAADVFGARTSAG
jgi:AcrR family transcriptional regulator